MEAPPEEGELGVGPQLALVSRGWAGPCWRKTARLIVRGRIRRLLENFGPSFEDGHAGHGMAAVHQFLEDVREDGCA